MRSISRSNCLETLAAGTAWGVFYQETKFPLHARLWVAQEKVYFIFCMNRRKEQKASLFSHSLQFVPKYFSDSHIYRHKLNFLQFQQNSFLSPTSFYDSQISSFLHCCYIPFRFFCWTHFVDEIYYKTHHFVVVNQFVDPAELEDHQSSENLHRCLWLESSIVILGGDSELALSWKHFVRIHADWGFVFICYSWFSTRLWYVTTMWNGS